MGSFGGYYKGDKKKLKRQILEKKAQNLSNSGSGFVLPKVEIIRGGKKEDNPREE